MSNSSNPLLANNKAIVLIPPHQSFIKQFSSKKYKRIVWSRKSKYDNVIALNEWNKVAVLRYVIAVPFIVFILISFLIFLIFVGPYYYINKQKANLLFDKYKTSIDTFLVNHSRFDWFTTQQDADKIINNPYAGNPHRVLYLHESQKKFLGQIDLKKVSDYIDCIWVYKHTSEIFERIIKEEFQYPLGKIVDFNVVSNHAIWNEKNRSKNKNDTTFEWVGNIDFHKTIFNVSAISSIDGKMHKPRVPAPRLRLKPNDFLDNEIVFYYESTYNKILNLYLTENYKSINEKLAKKGMKLLYFPLNIKEKNSKQFADILSYVGYKFPHLFTGDEQSTISLLTQVFKSTNLEGFYSTVAAILGIPDLKHPCFIHSVEIEKAMTNERKYLYSFHQFVHFDNETIAKEVAHYLELVKIPKEEIYFSLAASDPNDPDDNFSSDGNRISEDLKAFIKNLNAINDEKLIVDSLVFLIKKLQESQPDLCNQLNSTLFQKLNNSSSKVISKMVIDERYRIFLPDYNNIEIELNPLSKSLYIFLLRKPEGIIFKELSNYRNELIEIYSRVGNRLDMDQVKKSIYDLTDPRSNSINEKCSKIKEAFLSKIDDAVAKQYYITGSRSQNKLIKLDRSLLIFLK
jgi:hypothetical protein